MPDQFKKFLQEHRSELDDQIPPIDLFDQIMDKAGAEPKVRNMTKASSNISWLLIRIAASFLFLLIVLLGIDKWQESNSNSFVVSNKPQTIKHDINNYSAGQNIEKKAELTSSATFESHSKSLALNRNSKKVSKMNIRNDRSSVSEKIISSLPSENIIPSSESNNQVSYSQPINPVIETPAKITSVDQELTKNTSSQNNDIAVNSNIENNYQIIEEKNITNSSHLKEQQLNTKIKKGIFSFLSKKSRKWTGNILSIDPVEKDHSTHLAINFRSNKLEFYKSLKVPSVD